MKPFSLTSVCPKCGSKAASVEWKDDQGTIMNIKLEERIHRTCDLCSFSWDEAPLDHEENPWANPGDPVKEKVEADVKAAMNIRGQNPTVITIPEGPDDERMDEILREKIDTVKILPGCDYCRDEVLGFRVELVKTMKWVSSSFCPFCSKKLGDE